MGSVVFNSVLESLSSQIGLVQDTDQTEAEDRQGYAGYELGQDAEQPEVDLLQEFVVSLGDLAEVDSVHDFAAVAQELGHREGEIDRNAEDGAGDVRGEDGQLGPGHRAQDGVARREADCHESPNGDGYCQPRRDGMIDDREVSVAKSEYAPTVRELFLFG